MSRLFEKRISHGGSAPACLLLTCITPEFSGDAPCKTCKTAADVRKLILLLPFAFLLLPSPAGGFAAVIRCYFGK